ncbi:DUF2316 family protein [Niallia circulans]|uniref:DUF2316 family protein n=1 Tax=Niallia circulans TaxID=1397 RepID=A0A553SR64_NIACI|nr:DUF2316 family protein [Niallia circulans]TRZ39485.1 DUF2316 family protein [Niallia circulans]
MSLNSAQRQQTSMELKANFDISGLTCKEVQTDLGFSGELLEETLNVGSGTHGEAVWRLRDYLEEKIQEQGKEPHPYSILKTNIWYKYK